MSMSIATAHSSAAAPPTKLRTPATWSSWMRIAPNGPPNPQQPPIAAAVTAPACPLYSVLPSGGADRNFPAGGGLPALPPGEASLGGAHSEGEGEGPGTGGLEDADLEALLTGIYGSAVGESE